MQRADLRATLEEALRSRAGQKVVRTNGKVQFRCPRHDDKTPSAWLGDARWGCFACGFEERLDTLCDELGVERPAYGLSVEDYAQAKGFSLEKLAKWGVRTGTSDKGATVVVIPYRDASGAVLRNKLRGPKGSWWEGRDLPTHLYGLEMLAKTKPTMPVIVVEGESDCHACWHHAVLAVGVPGANGWRSAWAKHLAGREIYIWQEPDQGGAALVASLLKDFPAAKVITPPDGLKDLADLHRSDPQGFDARLTAMLASAVPAGQVPAIPFDAVVGAPLERLLQEKLAEVRAVPTPLALWNSSCRGAGGRVGLAHGWHVVVAGNTGAGKSLVALNVAAWAVQHGVRVGILSLEMSWSECATRALAIATGIAVERLEQGERFDPAAHAQAAREMAHWEQRGGAMYVNRDPLNKLEDITAAFDYLVEVLGCTLVVTDYMQLTWVERARDLLDHITEASHVIRGRAKRHRVVSLALSQFNRQTSNDYDNPPTPQGLMGGSPLENDADQVLLLDHSHYTRSEHGADTRLLLGKNRHGPQERIGLAWDYRTLQMREVPIREDV